MMNQNLITASYAERSSAVCSPQPLCCVLKTSTLAYSRFWKRRFVQYSPVGHREELRTEKQLPLVNMSLSNTIGNNHKCMRSMNTPLNHQNSVEAIIIASWNALLFVLLSNAALAPHFLYISMRLRPLPVQENKISSNLLFLCAQPHNYKLRIFTISNYCN